VDPCRPVQPPGGDGWHAYALSRDGVAAMMRLLWPGASAQLGPLGGLFLDDGEDGRSCPLRSLSRGGIVALPEVFLVCGCTSRT
jgi:hypothetical protein